MRTVITFVIGLVLGCASTVVYQQTVSGSSSPLLSLDGKAYTLDDLPPTAGRLFYEIDKEAWERKVQLLSGAAIELFVDRQVADTGESREKVLDGLLNIKVPTEEEINAFYEENRDQLQAPLEQIKDQIRDYLSNRDVQQQRNRLLTQLREEHAMDIPIAEPRPPLTVINTTGFPSKGPADAAFTLVEFADYQCPHCAQAARTLDSLVEQMNGSVRLVHMDFPIHRSGISRDVALGAVCADEQGKFWEYHKAAFARQQTLDTDSKSELARELELDLPAFEACLASDRPETRVSRAEAEARRIGVTGTPAFYLNGKVLQPENVSQGLIDTIRQKMAEG